MAGVLQHEIKKRHPFTCLEQEVYLNLLRTIDLLGRDFDELLRTTGISQTGYNVLRILRGAAETPNNSQHADGPEHSTSPHRPVGLPCGEIGSRLVTREPDVTRLLDRLEKRTLIQRHRCDKDRRVVYAAITPAGQALLASLDAPILALHHKQLSHLSQANLSKLIELLEHARSAPTASA
jgi:DNA-binding MarR family transcriptional regulator